MRLRSKNSVRQSKLKQTIESMPKLLYKCGIFSILEAKESVLSWLQIIFKGTLRMLRSLIVAGSVRVKISLQRVVLGQRDSKGQITKPKFHEQVQSDRDLDVEFQTQQTHSRTPEVSLTTHVLLLTQQSSAASYSLLLIVLSVLSLKDSVLTPTIDDLFHMRSGRRCLNHIQASIHITSPSQPL